MVNKQKLVANVCASVAVVAAGFAGWTCYEFITHNNVQEGKRQEALACLDEKAVHQDLIPKEENGIRWTAWLEYQDRDNDGDFESYVYKAKGMWMKEDAYIKIEKDEKGEFVFPDLEKDNISPLEGTISTYGGGLVINYADLDGDGKIESYTQLGGDRYNKELYEAKKIDGKYIFEKIGEE